MNIEMRIADAIYEQKLHQVAASILASDFASLNDDDKQLVQSASTACTEIRQHCIAEGRLIRELFSEAGVECEFDEGDPELQSRQYHSYTITLNASDPTDAVNLAIGNGYWHPLETDSAMWEVFRRSQADTLLTKTDAVTTRMRLRWDNDPSRFTRWLRPNEKDVMFRGLPAALWPLAYAAKPLRLAGRLLGFSPGRVPLGPFLGTPLSLIRCLLEFAGVSSDDVLLDLGCGDGRVLIEAARGYGCRASGYEQDGSLCAVAQSRAAEDGVDDLLQIHHADAADSCVEDASVIFLFLPVESIQKLIPGLIRRLSPGARIIAHEQLPLACQPAPDRSKPLICGSAITVAHIWTITA